MDSQRPPQIEPLTPRIANADIHHILSYSNHTVFELLDLSSQVERFVLLARLARSTCLSMLYVISD